MNFLVANRGKGRFEEIVTEAGDPPIVVMAVSCSGMGLDFCSTLNGGDCRTASILVAKIDHENVRAGRTSNLRRDLLRRGRSATGIGTATCLMSLWGFKSFDYDTNDGNLDLTLAECNLERPDRRAYRTTRSETGSRWRHS